MNRRCVIPLTAAMTIFALTSSAQAQTVERTWPTTMSCTFSNHNAPSFSVKFTGLTAPAHWVSAEWSVDGYVQETDPLSGQTASASFSPHFTGTHTVKVRAKYWLTTGEQWTAYLSWNAEVIPHPPTAECVSPGSPVTVQKGDTLAFTARGSDPGVFPEPLHITRIMWYVDGHGRGEGGFPPRTQATVEHTWSHTFDIPGIHEVEAVFYDADGFCSASGQALWTVEVESDEHKPSGTIVSPLSPVTVCAGTPVTFTLRGTDLGDDLRFCQASLDGTFQTNVSFNGAASGSTAAWTHTFDTPKTYRVAFTPVDSYSNYGAEQVWTVVVQDCAGLARLTGTVIGLDTRGTVKGPLSGAKVELAGPSTPTPATTD